MRPLRKVFTRHGFSLIEMTLILLVVTLILSNFIIVDSSKEGREARQTTKEKMDAIATALAEYVETNEEYPCVAGQAYVLGDAGYYLRILDDCAADTSVPGGSGTGRVDAGGGAYVRIGGVPTRNLGLADSYAEDEWGNRFTYAVTEALTGEGAYAEDSGIIAVKDAAGTDLTTNADYVIFSHGKDGKGAYRAVAGTQPVGCGATTNLDVENCDGDAVFRKAQITDTLVATASFNDDLIVHNGAADAGNGLLTDLVAYWKMNEVSGNRADSHGSNTWTQNGVIPGEPGMLGNWAEIGSVMCGGCYFSRSGNFGDGATSGQPFSWSLWMNYIYNWTAENFVGYYDGTNLFRIRLTNGRVQVNWGKTPFNGVLSTVIAGGANHHVVFTYSASGVGSLYINGALIGTDTSTTGSFTSAANIKFGIRGGDDAEQMFRVRVDEMGYWDRELTADDVTTLYNSGAPLPYEDFE